MTLLRYFLKIIFSLLTTFGILGYSQHLVDKRFFIPGNLTSFFIFLAGMLVFTVFWMLFLSKRGHFWSTLEHELTHALFATLFLKKINSISASRKKGGLITIEGGNSFIALSPYFFPLTPMLVLVIGLLLPDNPQIYVTFVLGISFQFHLINLLKELHPGQPDLQMSGYLFSGIIILFFNIFFLGILLAAIANGFSGILQFIWDGIKSSVYLWLNFQEYFFEKMRTSFINL
jgi:hypothetical protein